MKGYTAKVGLRRPQWSTVYAWSDSGKWVVIGRTACPVITPDFSTFSRELSTLREAQGTLTLTALPLEPP